MDGSKNHDHESQETIDIPLPTDEQRQSSMPAHGDIHVEIEDVSQEGGHFTVDYRRC